jgi:hypothetical protein
VELSSQILDEERRARRRVERESDLGPGALSQVEAGFPILYDLDGELVKEYPDGSRYVVRLVDLGRSDVHVREI